MKTDQRAGPVVVPCGDRMDLVCPDCENALATIWVPVPASALSLYRRAVQVQYERHRRVCKEAVPLIQIQEARP